MMLGSWSRTVFRISGAAAVAAVALAVAACGSSGSSSGAGNAAASSSASAGGTSVATASGADGKYLVGSSGRALYLWVADPSGKSVCAAACAKFWPPLLTKSAPAAAGGVTAAHLGTITRSNGSQQVTYDGHPLYYFALDKGRGSIKGQGNDGFGAKWWLVSPSGSAITSFVAASATGSSSGSSGASGGY
jgi:predicted lipoprotein with Yx(FWY)xxD motif